MRRASLSDVQELGELLGFAVGTDCSRAKAVPVELAGSSALLVSTQTPPPASTSRPAPPTSTPGPASPVRRSAAVAANLNLAASIGAQGCWSCWEPVSSWFLPCSGKGPAIGTVFASSGVQTVQCSASLMLVCHDRTFTEQAQTPIGLG